MTRVLVVCAEPVGPQMAGPAIRALELARALAAEHQVRLAAPAPSVVEDPRIELVEAGFEDYDTLHGAIAVAEVVVAQQLPVRMLSLLPRLDTRLIADLYNPSVFEVLEAGRDKPLAARRRQQLTVAHGAVAQLAAASQVICASETQRDLWLGVMAAHGLVELQAYDRDPTLRSVIDVVPFGLPAEPPIAAPGSPIRERFPAIAADDRIVLWGGGIWNWLDPECAVDAIGLLEQRRTSGPRTHLVVMGMARPAIEAVDEMGAGDRFLEHLGRSGLEGEVVHLNRGWLPYDERGGWLLDADLGISTHRDHLETRFAFRTRVLDCLWARLPVVASSGDALAELIARERLGLTAAPGDSDGLAVAIDALLGNPGAYAAAVGAIDAIAPSFSWERASAPLRAFCSQPGGGAGVQRGVLRRATLAQYPRRLADTRERLGVRGAAAQLWRNARRALTPGR